MQYMIHTPDNSASRQSSITWEGLQPNMNQHCTLPTTKANNSLVFANRTKLHIKGTDIYLSLFIIWSPTNFQENRRGTKMVRGLEYLPYKTDAVSV